MCSLELVPLLRLKKKCTPTKQDLSNEYPRRFYMGVRLSWAFVFVHDWESAKRNLNLNLLTVWFEVIFFKYKVSVGSSGPQSWSLLSGFLCFKRPGVYVLPEWNVYRKREGDLKYVTDLIVAFNLLEKRKQLSESYILQNATIICFGVIVQPLIFDITETRFLPFFEGLVIQYQSYCRICQQTFVRRSHSTDCTSMFIWGNG